MDVVYFFRVLLKRKWIIIGSAIIAAFVAWFLTRGELKTYRSSTRITTGYALAEEIKVNDNVTMIDADIKFNNAITTWTSPSVISLLSYQLILHDLTNSNPFRRLKPDQLKSEFYKSIDKVQAQKVFQNKLDSMNVLTSYKPDEKQLLEFLDMYGYGYKSLTNNLQIFQVQRTDYIEVDCATENPELSAYIVNNSFKQFLRYFRNIRSVRTQESLDTLQNMMDKKKSEWDEKTKVLKGEGLIDVATENTSKLDLISEYEKSLTDEKARQTDDQFALKRVNQKLGISAGPTPGTTPTTTAGSAPGENEELVMVRKAANEAYADYLKSPDKDKLARYSQLKADYEKKYASLTTPETTTTPTGTGVIPDKRSELQEKRSELEERIEASNQKVKSLEKNIADLRSNISSTSSKGANVETLLEEAKLAERDYFEAKTKYNNAVDVTSSAVNNFRQTQIAQPAIEPEPSKRKVLVGMAGAVTGLTSILVIVFLTYLDSSLRTPGIFSRTVNLRLLSIVNFMNLKNKPLIDIITTPTREEDQVENKRNNVFRESIRKLRYEIENSGRKIFLFTSTQKGQGKTTLIQALSYSLSMSRKKILIIDTNFSNNDLTVQMHADPVLEKIADEKKQMTLKEKVKAFSTDISLPSSPGKICIIGSEGGDYTPSEVLPRENLLTGLHSLLPEFDYIFLEGPPLNDFSDSKELIRYVDGVVAIFSAKHIMKQIDKESIHFFKELNGKFCGSVLNMIDLENVNVI